MPSAIAKEPPCVVTITNDTDVVIPEKPLLSSSPVTSSITVPDVGIVKDVNITLDIAHVFASDIRAFLLHGAGGVGVINAAHPGSNFTGTTSRRRGRDARCRPAWRRTPGPSSPTPRSTNFDAWPPRESGRYRSPT